MTAQKSFKIVMAFALAFLPLLAFSQEESSVEEFAEEFNATEMIM